MSYTASAMIQAPFKRPDRSQEIALFLRQAGWGDAKRSHLAGDASFRAYERIEGQGRHAVLMDAPPPFEDVRPFVKVTHLLRAAGLSAPELFYADEEQGFLLLEDLGDDSYSRVLKASVEQELALYNAAMDALLLLQAQATSDSIPLYDEAVYLREVGLFSDWFMPQIVGRERALQLREEYLDRWREILAAQGLRQTVLVHRDYHADNLLWLGDRDASQRVGMLDYQDALKGDPYYDVVSLLEDARRDVADDSALCAFRRFVEAKGDSEAEGQRYVSILGAQRNLKIVGIFTRLAVRDKKPHYLHFLPRVWGHLVKDLQHPAMKPIRDFIEQHVPAQARGVIAVDDSLGSIAP